MPLLALLLGGCHSSGDASSARARSETSITVTDDAGRLVRLGAPAARVVSLLPAQTEMVQQLAGPAVLVARTQWDTDPGLAHLPSTGNALTPSVEWLVSLHPDLVIAWPDQDARTVIARLESLGIPVYASATESLAGIDSTIARLGVLLGQEARADSLRGELARQLAGVRSRVAGRSRPSVLYALSIDPPMAAGNSTYIGELLELAGGRNSFADLRSAWPQVSLEEVVRRNPEIVIRPVEAGIGDILSQLRRAPGWRELRAVRQGRVYAVGVNLLNRPGLHVGEAALVLARAIHPEVFGRQP